MVNFAYEMWCWMKIFHENIYRDIQSISITPEKARLLIPGGRTQLMGWLSCRAWHDIRAKPWNALLSATEKINITFRCSYENSIALLIDIIHTYSKCSIEFLFIRCWSWPNTLNEHDHSRSNEIFDQYFGFS